MYDVGMDPVPAAWSTVLIVDHLLCMGKTCCCRCLAVDQTAKGVILGIHYNNWDIFILFYFLMQTPWTHTKAVQSGVNMHYYKDLDMAVTGKTITYVTLWSIGTVAKNTVTWKCSEIHCLQAKKSTLNFFSFFFSFPSMMTDSCRRFWV